MKLVLALCFIGTVAFGYKYEDSFLEHASVVNAAKTTWTAGYNEYFAGMDWSDVKKRLGAFLGKVDGVETKVVQVRSAIPETFDAREQWPTCKSRISEIRDQSNCGSCWAVSAAIVATDRTCVASNGAVNVDLSAEDLLACCGFSCGMGCNGGYPIRAMQYWAKTGLVTGGNYGDKSTCAPYQIAPCPCSQPEASTPKCVKSCQTSYNKAWTSDKHTASSAYQVGSSVAQIQSEILAHGPVQAGFTVYADFMHYKSGVYQHVSGGVEGGHAVTIIGWGTENNTPYWLVKNQWNTTWGDNGLFKIIRGTNDCDFESGIVAGLPKL